jgi:hypothetical protein
MTGDERKRMLALILEPIRADHADAIGSCCPQGVAALGTPTSTPSWR